MAFHWLSCGSLSLAGLLLGKEKTFLPVPGVDFFLFLLGLRLAEEWWGVRAPPAGRWVSFQRRFPFTNFHTTVLILEPHHYGHKLIGLGSSPPISGSFL